MSDIFVKPAAMKQLVGCEYWPQDPPYHYGKISANTVFDWMPSDTEESYHRMMQDPKHREYFAQQGWDQPGAITYRINSEGFRGDDFDGSDYLVSLGCSFTMGIGLPEKDVWPYRLGRALGLSVANLSWGGQCADSCLRLAAYWIPRLRPKLVCMLAPPPDRFEIFVDTGSSNRAYQAPIETIMSSTKIAKFEHDAFLKHYFINEKNSTYNRFKNILAIKQICVEFDTPCIVYCAWNAFGREREEVGYARDYMHAGPRGHEILTNNMLNDYDKIQHR